MASNNDYHYKRLMRLTVFQQSSPYRSEHQAGFLRNIGNPVAGPRRGKS